MGIISHFDNRKKKKRKNGGEKALLTLNHCITTVRQSSRTAINFFCNKPVGFDAEMENEVSQYLLMNFIFKALTYPFSHNAQCLCKAPGLTARCK